MLDGISELRDRFITVDVFGGRDAIRRNAASLREAVQWLRGGHLLVVFPSGEVSHWQSRQCGIADPPWNTLAARCATIAGTPVVPAFFAGDNSFVFQLAGFVHPRLRTARLPAELLNKRGRTIEIRFGSAVPPRDLTQCGSLQQATSYLRARTYMLGRRQLSDIPPRPAFLPFRPRIRLASIAPETGGVAGEIANLKGEGNCTVDCSSYSVYRAVGRHIPAILNEVGRLREIAFRLVGEGSGNNIDLDRFDNDYTHLILWHKADAKIAGAYRLAWTEDVLPTRGIGGLYTSTLFRYAPEFFAQLGPAVELGRSFVRPEYQKQFAALLLLWQAIAAVVAARPTSPVLFGAVSISSSYSEPCRQLMVEFLKQRRCRADLACFVKARHPFRLRAAQEPDFAAIAETVQEFDELPLADLQDSVTVPVLLKQYLRLGGMVAGFNVDPKFSGALDGLLIADLRKAPKNLLSKYMGPQVASSFLARF